jgi:hypothetical protein
MINLDESTQLKSKESIHKIYHLRRRKKNYDRDQLLFNLDESSVVKMEKKHRAACFNPVNNWRFCLFSDSFLYGSV